jgi:hypothetical protein
MFHTRRAVLIVSKGSWIMEAKRYTVIPTPTKQIGIYADMWADAKSERQAIR